LWQTFDDLQEGATYTVRFRARADAPRRVNLSAQAAEPYRHDNIGLNEAVPLTKNWQPYEYEFRAKDLAAQNAIVFNVGEQTGTVRTADSRVPKGGVWGAGPGPPPGPAAKGVATMSHLSPGVPTLPGPLTRRRLLQVGGLGLLGLTLPQLLWARD